MLIYISGKIAGQKDYRERFFKAEYAIIDACFTADYESAKEIKIFNPARITYPEEKYKEALQNDMKYLFRADAIYMLDNWLNSKGAQAEYYVAKALGLPVFYESDNNSLLGIALMSKMKYEEKN